MYVDQINTHSENIIHITDIKHENIFNIMAMNNIVYSLPLYSFLDIIYDMI